ncbi:MAG: caspase family protein [Roseiarcus sp.]
MTVRPRSVAASWALLLGLAWGLAAAQAQDAAGQNPRIALVVGEAAYPDRALATTANDAGLVAQTLQAAGFEVVGARDLDQNGLRGAMRDFLDRAAAIGPEMEAFVYLAGRGVQYDGDNYFLPVDARIARDADIPLQAVKISDFSHALAATPGRARVIVLDAARANAFAAGGAALAGGLGLVDPEEGTLLAFDAAPGTVAPDEPGPYGVYGKSLAGALREGGTPIDDVFAQTRLQVSQLTSGGVIPWSVSKIPEPYSIFARAPDAPPPPAVARLATRPLKTLGPDEAYSVALERDTFDGYREFLAAYPDSAPARRVRAILAARREASFWRRSADENSPRAYWTYLQAYPKGPHAADAGRRLRILSALAAPPPDFAPLDYDDLPPPPPDERRYGEGPAFVFDDPDYGAPPPPPDAFLPERDERWRDLPPPPPPRGYGFLPALAIPLLLGAEAYHQHRREGAAQTQQPAPGAPPPLPPGVRPHGPAPGGPAPAAGDAAKPLPLAPGVHAPGGAVAPAGESRPPLPAAAAPARPAAEPAAPAPRPSPQQPKTAPAEPPGARPAPAGQPVAPPAPAKAAPQEQKSEPPRPAAPPPAPPPPAAAAPQPKAPPSEQKSEPPRPAAPPVAPQPPPAAAPAPQPKAPPSESKTESPRPVAPQPPPAAAPASQPKAPPSELKTEPPRPAAPQPAAAPAPQPKAPPQELKVEPPRPAAAPVAPKPPPAAAPPPQAKAPPPQPAPSKPSRPACGAANEPPCPK